MPNLYNRYKLEERKFSQNNPEYMLIQVAQIIINHLD
jgi:hypothetical protein